MSADNIRPVEWESATSDPLEVQTRTGLLDRFPRHHFDAVERL